MTGHDHHTAARDELAAEQQHVDRAYARLEELQEGARRMALQALADDPGGGHQSRLDRETLIVSAQRRLADLHIGDAPICFGRMDMESGDVHHIGRIGIHDVDQDQLVMDWRAPAAEPFYRATGRQPLEVVRRRHLICRGRNVLALDDELLDGTEAHARGLHLVGEAALLDALDRARTGRMGDIVATIQTEQDQIIRAPLSGVIAVQGGPGTGKTAVALHRVAYLLYTHRFPLEDHGVLVVGPNPLFLRYVDRVLPSLGEQSVIMATLANLVPNVRVAGHDDRAIARIKGDKRMATVIARALGDRQRALPRKAEIPYGTAILRLSPGASRSIVERAKALPGTHNERRLVVERQVLNRLWRLWQEVVERDVARGRRGAPQQLDAEGERAVRRQFDEAVRRTAAYRETMERMWPVLSPHALLHDLLGSKALLRSAGEGVLTDDEIDALHRARSATVAEVPWTAEDVPLLDEAIPLLGTIAPGQTPGSRSTREDTAWLADRVVDEMRRYVEFLDPGLQTALTHRLAAAAEQEWWGGFEERVPLWERTFGHVVVDEAQELAPMAWRMLARRCPRGSMTIVGDLGQAANPLAPRAWADLSEHLPGNRVPNVAELTVNYRTPAEIMDVAARLLPIAAPGLRPPQSARAAGVAPQFRRADPGMLVDEVAFAVAHLMEEVEGNVAVISPPEMVGALALALGVNPDPTDLLGLPVVLLTPDTAKGLEFDAVVVVEPALIAGDTAEGLRSLYVALTRPTQRLTVVHQRPLPAALHA